MVTIKTSLGDIKIELFTDKAPKTCENFLKYCSNDFYKDTIFHRVIKNFMIQGGGLTQNLEEKKENKFPPIENEATNGLSNDKYTIAMARTSDPHSATSQFFINTKDNNYLNHTGKNLKGWGYCVFGKVISGQDVVDAIENIETTTKYPYQDVPTETIIILDVIIE
jgi:peptidyl-prolyl cis-trans isomerase B (cyclophilin B)